VTVNTSTIQVRVARKRVEALDICTIELVEANGAALPAFSAGSHIDVELPGGITRQYSLCNDPSEGHRYLLGVLKDPATRGGSRTMHEVVKEGDTLRISTPKNHFALAHDASRHLLLAGGIGVTPILCMAERLAVLGGEFEMHYCTRSKERTAFVERIGASSFADKVNFHFDDGAPEQKLDVGGLLATPQPSTHLYVCGPKGFMSAVLDSARAMGWPEAHLHYEFFSADVVKSGTDGSFEVKLASSGQLVVVASNQTVVQALAAAGVEVPVSCEQGVCGTCLTRVLQGIPDHRDLYLSPDEQAKNDQFTPCCSRSLSPLLVLDL
jgi:vanillate monooxygenase ferredoxin subunit